jgi:hypothetical protein
MELLIMKFSQLPCYLVSLTPKYSLQHSILKHPQPTFLPQCQRSSFKSLNTKITHKMLTSLWKQCLQLDVLVG